MIDEATVSETIFAAHAAHFGVTARPIVTQAAQATPPREATDRSRGREPDAVYQGAMQACTALGFISVDARCLAGAWSHRTLRTGRFDALQWPDTPVDFGLASFPPNSRTNAFARCPHDLGLYAVLPDAAWISRMARVGVPTLQLRFKSDDAAAVEREVSAAVRAVRGTSALLFINDHWRAAIDAGAYGVHLGQEDLAALPASDLQSIRHAGLRLGLSTHGYAEMVRADAASPSYVAMGAVFATTLKRMETAPQGLARLAAYARLMHGYSQVAIGGIDLERLDAVLATGVGSVAVVRALVTADDPDIAAAWWLKAVAKGAAR